MKKVESLTEELFELRKKTLTSSNENYKIQQEGFSPRNQATNKVPHSNHSNQNNNSLSNSNHSNKRLPRNRSRHRRASYRWLFNRALDNNVFIYLSTGYCDFCWDWFLLDVVGTCYILSHFLLFSFIVLLLFTRVVCSVAFIQKLYSLQVYCRLFCR